MLQFVCIGFRSRFIVFCFRTDLSHLGRSRCLAFFCIILGRIKSFVFGWLWLWLSTLPYGLGRWGRDPNKKNLLILVKTCHCRVWVVFLLSDRCSTHRWRQRLGSLILPWTREFVSLHFSLFKTVLIQFHSVPHSLTNVWFTPPSSRAETLYSVGSLNSFWVVLVWVGPFLYFRSVSVVYVVFSCKTWITV